MEKVKISPIERIKNIIIFLLTLAMLVLASVYIGGTQFAGEGSARDAAMLPSGFVAVGQEEDVSVGIYEKELLPASYIGIRFGESCGGTYANAAAADSLTDFAYEYIHKCLESGGELGEISHEKFCESFNGNFLLINLTSPLPYQVIYALTGEYSSSASSKNAVNADKLVICENGGKITLRLSDGSSYYESSGVFEVGVSQMSALAHDTRLSHFSVDGYGNAISPVSPVTHKIEFVEALPFDFEQQKNIAAVLGYDTDGTNVRSPFSNIFSPLGTLQINMSSIGYSAAKESGIPMSDFLVKSKNEIDIDMYDMLTASVSLVEKMREIAPEQLGAPLGLQITGFYYDAGMYTVTLGLACDGIGVYGERLPYFAKITSSAGRFKSIDIMLIDVYRENYMAPVFPSEFTYNYASGKAEISSLFLRYPIDSLPTASISPTWYYVEKGGAKN